jgi:Ni2+-binding GTPase involved in maturation of urease and hydrogenase
MFQLITLYTVPSLRPGAGKTTLLKHILRLNNDKSDADKLKMAVIVNDM